MKKASIALVVLLFTVLTNSFAQTTATPASASTPSVNADFFVGKWALVFVGTPNGDGKLTMTLTRKDGKLIGDLVNPTGEGEKIVLTNVEEEKEKIVIYFSAQGYDVSVDLAKVDNDNLKGMLMNMFESTAKRIVE
ncbi:MAG: hypothetical protein JNL70_15770 [Saprospiraceae bacterium]|nr:hypothetical protein [Saprospiraceae bacterium]